MSAVDAPRASDDRRAAGILAAFFLARFAFAATLGLGVDESYTLAVSRRLSLSYFDHPPLHQWIAHFAALAFGETVAARLPFLLLFAASGWLLYRLTQRLFDSRAGLIALVALNASPFFFASAGAWIVPDGPLLLALAGGALALARLVDREVSGADAWRAWLCAGVCLGLAMLSKYSAVLSALGIATFLVASPRQRRWLRHPAPYVAAAVALAMFTPAIVWNAEHGWVSFAFQGARGVATTLRPFQVGAMALGEALYLSPWIAAPLFAALLASWTRRAEDRRLFLLCLALPPILVFTVTPFWGARGFPHWPMPGWFFAFALLGAHLREVWTSTRLRRAGIVATGLLALLAVVVVSEAATGWMFQLAPLPPSVNDPTLEAFAWNNLRGAAILDPRPTFVLSDKWSDAGKIAVALGPATPVLTLGGDPRGMAFVEDSADFLGGDGVLIVRRAELESALAAARPYFVETGAAFELTLGRHKRPEIVLSLVRLRGLTRPLPMPYPNLSRRAP